MHSMQTWAFERHVMLGFCSSEYADSQSTVLTTSRQKTLGGDDTAGIALAAGCDSFMTDRAELGTFRNGAGSADPEH